jgi:uncharacterized protein with HEPN domain
VKQVRQGLEDIIRHAGAVARLVARGKEAFDADEMLRFAAEDLIIRLGESVQRIDQSDPEFASRHPTFDLRKLKDARNILAHGYDIVDYEIVWSIMERNIPVVATAIEGFLRADDEPCEPTTS